MKKIISSLLLIIAASISLGNAGDLWKSEKLQKKFETDCDLKTGESYLETKNKWKCFGEQFALIVLEKILSSQVDWDDWWYIFLDYSNSYPEDEDSKVILRLVDLFADYFTMFYNWLNIKKRYELGTFENCFTFLEENCTDSSLLAQFHKKYPLLAQFHKKYPWWNTDEVCHMMLFGRESSESDARTSEELVEMIKKVLDRIIEKWLGGWKGTRIQVVM